MNADNNRRAQNAIMNMMNGQTLKGIGMLVDAVHVAKIKNLYWRDCEHLMASRSFDIKL